MRSISPELVAASTRQHRQPIVGVRVADTPLEIPRFDLAEIYADSVGDQYHSAALAADGSILRARLSATGRLFWQRIADPTDPGQWTTWTDTGSDWELVTPAIAADDGRSNVAIYLVGQDHNIYNRDSHDHGVTWAGGWSKIKDLGASYPTMALAASGRYGHTHTVFLQVNPGGGAGHDNYLAILHWSGSEWVYDTQPQLRYPCRGMSVDWSEDGWAFIYIADGYDVAFSPEYPRISLQEWGDAGSGPTWQGGAVLIESSPASGFSYDHPHFTHATTDFPRHIITYAETYGGDSTPCIAFTPVRFWIAEVVPWPHPTACGIAIVKTLDLWYFIAGDRACRSAVFDAAAGDILDIPQDDVVEIDVAESLMRPGRLTITLDNSAGKYSSAGQPGAHRCLRPGSQICLSLGYHIPADPQAIPTAPWWIQRIRWQDHPLRGEAYCVLECIDSWAWLETLRARTALEWHGQSLGYVLQRIWWRLCGVAEGVPHGNLAITVPHFAINPRDSYAPATRRLCQSTGVALRFRTDPDHPTGVGFDSVQPEVFDFATGPADYVFGPDNHPIVEATHTTGGQTYTTVEVYGLTHFGISRDWPRIQSDWKDIALKVVDHKLDTQAKVDDRAVYEARLLTATGDHSDLTVWANPALEPGDVIEITGLPSGLEDAHRVILAIRTVYRRRRHAVFHQMLTLGGVG